MCKIWIFGGTTEGRLLAEYCSREKIEAWVSVASEYGEELLQEELTAGRSGYLQYEREDGGRYVYYQPLNVNQWYLLSIVPDWVVDENVNGMLRLAYTLSLIHI